MLTTQFDNIQVNAEIEQISFGDLDFAVLSGFIVGYYEDSQCFGKECGCFNNIPTTPLTTPNFAP